MANFRLDLEYDGTGFHGWQIQPGVRTVQGVVQDALAGLVGRPVTVHGCCRTDAGVHAWGFVGSFEADTRLEPGQIRRALAGRLPDDVVVRECEAAPADFHARHSCVARRYVYKFTTARTAVFRHVLAYSPYDLDAGRMARAARLLVGEHDFSSFTPSALDERISRVCTVFDASVDRDGAVVSLDIRADRFLHHMVRNIAGTLVEVGRGRIEPERIEQILGTRDRRAAGPTAPACGLVLMAAYYKD